MDRPNNAENNELPAAESAENQDSGGDSVRHNGACFHERTRALTSRDMRKFLVNGPPPGTLASSAGIYFPDFEFRPVQTMEELKKASHLVYQEYVKSGFILPNKDHFKFSLFQAAPSTVTFAAIYRKERVLATLTLVEDSPLGLPMENLYYDELIKFRVDNRRIAEFTMLAVDKEIMGSSNFFLRPPVRWILLFHLIRSAYDYLRTCTTVDTSAACFHPKHESFYKMLNMAPLGSLRYHAGVKGKPALARYCYFPEVVQQGNSHTTTRLFLKELPARITFSRRLRFSETEIRELLVEHSNILASADDRKLNYFRDCYPTIDIDQLIKSRTLFSYLVDALEERSIVTDATPPTTLDRKAP